MTAYRPGLIGCKPKQNANEGCNSCASLAGLVLCFIACFIYVAAKATYIRLLLGQNGGFSALAT